MSIPAQGAVGAETMTAGQSLDLRDLHAANIARQAEWCPDQVPDLSFRGNELGGECGEAQNVIKKLERERHGWRGSRATKDDLADELADVVICADLCAVTADIDLGAAVRRKFNATSEKQGLSVFLPLPALASPRADSDERTAGEDITVEGAPGNRLAPWLLSGSDEEVIEALMRRSAGDVACLFFPTPVNVADPIRRTYYEGRPPRQQRLLAELLCRLKPATPAQPAGAVPDSLREVFEAAKGMLRLSEMGFEESLKEPEESGNFAAYTRVKAAIAAAEPLLASHPAGQSAGSGADGKVKGERPPNRPGSDKPCFFVGSTGYDAECKTCGQHTPDYERQDFECPWKGKPAPDSTRTGQVGLREALARSLTKSIAGGSPDRYRIEIACPDLATMQVLRDGLVSLRDNPAAITAPHDDGFTADELREIRAAIMELGAGAIRTQKITDHQAANDLQRHCIGRIERALASRLAARPAAPESQGAWQDISTAPKDGSYVLGYGPHESRGSYVDAISYWNNGWPIRFMHGFGEPTHWMPLPAPPASSGQGGR